MEKKVFRSRISVLLIVLLLACFLPGLIMIFNSGNIFNSGTYIVLIVFTFIIVVMTGTRYIIADKQLTIKICGISFRAFPLSAIVSVERSYNPLSSPAASLKRLGVQFKHGFYWPYCLVSPVREKEFLERLKELNPDIYIRVIDKKAWYRIWDWDI